MMTAPKKTLTFLIVDDDIPLSLFFKETLVRNDHRVFVAVNEHGALEVFKNESVDILICDLVLPGLDGTQIIKFVKQQSTRTFCVLISGHHDQIFSNEMPPNNADMVIGKPIFKETLDGIIQQYLLQHSDT
jgi:DNA-binding NtrC family response regulator